MSNKFSLDESLSALMDDEVNEFELRRILKHLSTDNEQVSPDDTVGKLNSSSDSSAGSLINEDGLDGRLDSQEGLKDKWRRYHLISSMIKQEVHTNPSVDLLAGIRQQLDKETTIITARPPVAVNGNQSSSLLKSFFQGAIAVSAAVGVFFTANLLITPATVAPGFASNEAVNFLDANSLPVFNGDFKATGLTRTVSFAGSERSRARSRLSQAVYRALEEDSDSIEISVESVDLDTENVKENVNMVGN